uniref:Hexosyltransferase n=1 Tax=Hucho hucho TaxID=62062 RepID=A0A4W5LTV9_9TELE
MFNMDCLYTVHMNPPSLFPCIYVYAADFNFTDEGSAASPCGEVLVGVLSARHHYDLRQAIRQTWLGYLRDHRHYRHRYGSHNHGN